MGGGLERIHQYAKTAARDQNILQYIIFLFFKLMNFYCLSMLRNCQILFN